MKKEIFPPRIIFPPRSLPWYYWLDLVGWWWPQIYGRIYWFLQGPGE